MAELLARMPWRRRGAIPLADAAGLAFALRRSTLIRLALGGSIIVLGAFSVWRAAHLDPRPVAFLPPGSTTVVVIDQSKSIFAGSYKRLRATLLKLVDADVPIGLVAFSDTSYEMMPPGARGSDLKPMLRFYTPAREGPNVDPETAYPTSPWDNIFAGGTKISSGLNLAESMLKRDHVHNGTILLVSDLQTASDDEPSLAQALVQLERQSNIRLKVVPLFALAQDRSFFERFVPSGDFVKPSQLAVHGSSAQAGQSLVGRMPWVLVIIAAVLLAVLAVNELLCGRLYIHRPKESAA